MPTVQVEMLMATTGSGDRRDECQATVPGAKREPAKDRHILLFSLSLKSPSDYAPSMPCEEEEGTAAAAAEDAADREAAEAGFGAS